jgi:2-dehydro-3-deoxyphosphogluconate aldolase/(4S)-4-hydroxy-2-oxoglutarate aldolase
MLDKQKVITAIEQHKIIVILRGLNKEQLISTVDAMIKGGIKLVEVTFDQSGVISDTQTARNIKVLREHFNGLVHVGAGTVLTKKQVYLAHKAGAEFIISPDCNKGVIKKTRRLNMVSIPGVFTPTDVANAHRYGADFAKLFPNSEIKLSYLKALAVPFSNVKFLAVGGVTHDNMAEYFSAGAKGIGVATAIVNKSAINESNYAEITRLSKLFTDKI